MDVQTDYMEILISEYNSKICQESFELFKEENSLKHVPSKLDQNCIEFALNLLPESFIACTHVAEALRFIRSKRIKQRIPH